MPVNLRAPDAKDLFAVPGVRVGVTMAGVRKPNKRDLVVFTLDEHSSVAGVFTTNRFCAAPVQLCREHLGHEGNIRALLINTGNANAGTGEDGLARARRSCASLAALMQLRAAQVLPFSTGVIMETLPVERIEAGLPAALAALRSDGWLDAAHGIMTTDTLPKAASRQVQIDGRSLGPIRRLQGRHRSGQAGLNAVHRQRFHDHTGGEGQHLRRLHLHQASQCRSEEHTSELQSL